MAICTSAKAVNLVWKCFIYSYNVSQSHSIKHEIWSHEVCLPALDLPQTSHVTLGKLLKLSGPQCSHLCNKGSRLFLSAMPILTVFDSSNNHKNAERNSKAIRFIIPTYAMLNHCGKTN